MIEPTPQHDPGEPPEASAPSEVVLPEVDTTPEEPPEEPEEQVGADAPQPSLPAHRDLAHGRIDGPTDVTSEAAGEPPLPQAEAAPGPVAQDPPPARGAPVAAEGVAHDDGRSAPSSAPQDRPTLDPTAWGAERARALSQRRDLLRPGGGPEIRAPARVLAFANQKGGVGKTTTVISLGAAMTEQGSRVLLVDMDPQGSLGVGLGLEPHELETTIYNLLMQDGSHPDDVIVESGIAGLHVLPANIDLAAAELALVQEVAREQALRRVIDRVRYRYDFILIDCPPSLGLLTVNGLTAADGVIVPLECEYFALRGMSLLMDTIDKVRNRLNPELALEGIVATIFDGRTLHAREVLDRVRDAFGDMVFKTTINKTIRFAEAPVVGESILTYAPRSKGSDAYRDLAREVLSRESSS